MSIQDVLDVLIVDYIWDDETQTWLEYPAVPSHSRGWISDGEPAQSFSLPETEEGSPVKIEYW